LKKKHGDVKISIVRPSIVISSYEEPFLGWCESLSALGGLLFAVMIGLVNYLYCNNRQILDVVPVDYCSNLIIAATAYTSKQPSGAFNVIHSSSSNQNPI
jgi:fatty acyl-CoA reductase